MEKKDLVPWNDALHYLKTAALHPQRRGEMIARALQQLLTSLPAVGTALIWPNRDGTIPWQVYYAGIRQKDMQRWLAARLDPSLDATLGVLQQDLLRFSDMPFPNLVCLQPASASPAGLWIVWSAISPLPQAYMQEIRLTLEALIEVANLEEHYFSDISLLSDPALIAALEQGVPHALSAVLSLTRLIGNAELAFWGRVYRDVIETKDHIGARQSGFGFTLPRGRGIGGHIISHGSPIIFIEDYRNSSFRDSSVTNIVDGEQICSGIALPVRARQGQERSGDVTGILYVARRIVKPFSLAESLLVQRLTSLLEPLPPPTPPFTFHRSW